LSFILLAVVAFIAAVLMEMLTLWFLIPLLKESGVVKENYERLPIPVSAGISFPIALTPIFIMYELLDNNNDGYTVFLFGIVAISFLGFIDDLLGKHDTKGFKGHIGSLLKGKLTTGGLKAAGGGFIALYLAVSVSSGYVDILINTILLALFTNMLNLLDLRPGRAIKGFLFLLLVISLLGYTLMDWLLLIPLLGTVIYYLPMDLKVRAMLGDAGSNVLGLALGYAAVTSLSQLERIGFLVFLVAIHLYTEKYSLTQTIERISVLNRLDKLGR